MSAATHSSRRSATHLGSTGRWPTPLSPPTITQWMRSEPSRTQHLAEARWPDERLAAEEPHRRLDRLDVPNPIRRPLILG